LLNYQHFCWVWLFYNTQFTISWYTIDYTKSLGISYRYHCGRFTALSDQPAVCRCSS